MKNGFRVFFFTGKNNRVDNSIQQVTESRFIYDFNIFNML